MERMERHNTGLSYGTPVCAFSRQVERRACPFTENIEVRSGYLLKIGEADHVDSSVRLLIDQPSCGLSGEEECNERIGCPV